MSRKTKLKKRSGGAAAPVRRRPLGKGAAILAVCLLLVGAAFAATRLATVRRAVGLAPLLPDPVAQQGPGGPLLAKEYIYAGGRLVATEEPAPQPTPTPTPVGSPPSNLVALLATVNGTAAGINVSWSPPASGGQVASYVVERKEAGGEFQPVGQPLPAPAVSFDDVGEEGAAYLYRVKALFASGGGSEYSNADLVTAVAFTDDPLVGANDPEGRPATRVYARHLRELRRAVSAVHLLAGQGAVNTWTYSDPAGQLIRMEDVADLRQRLDEAFSALRLTPPPYDDPTLTKYVTKVKKEHFQQLRQAVK